MKEQEYFKTGTSPVKKQDTEKVFGITGDISYSLKEITIEEYRNKIIPKWVPEFVRPIMYNMEKRLFGLKPLEQIQLFRLKFPSLMKAYYSENDTVYATYYKPRNTSDIPAVVIVNRQTRFNAEGLLSMRLASEGFAILEVHLPFTKNREPDFLQGRSMVYKVQYFLKDLNGFKNFSIQSVKDVRSAVAWLKRQPEVNPQHIGILGISVGSMVSGIVYGIDSNVKKSVLLLGGGSFAYPIWYYEAGKEVKEKVMEEGITTLEKLIQELSIVDPMYYTDEEKADGLMIINARYDDMIPRKRIKQYWEAFGKPSMEEWPGGHVTALMRHPSRIIKKITEHFSIKG